MIATWRAFRRAGWAPCAVFIFHLVLSRGFNIYERYQPADIPMHFLGGWVIAYWFDILIQEWSREKLLHADDRVTHTLLTFGMVCMAVVVWEFAEFLSDLFLKTKAQNGDLPDTLLDQLLGMLGGLSWLSSRSWFIEDKLT